MINVEDKKKIRWDFIETATREEIQKIEEMLARVETSKEDRDSKNYFIVEEKGSR